VYAEERSAAMKRFDPFAETFHFLHQNGKTGGYTTKQMK
jgi:hypothetical protein